ncbi:MAG: energy transducer TonB [Congregibacter sp.]
MASVVTGDATGGNDRLMFAILIASALHVLVIFGIRFDAWRTEQMNRQVEVTLVQQTSKRPVEAQHIAQTDQTGSGREAQRERPTGADGARAQPLPPQAPSQRQLINNAGRERLAAPAVTSTQANRAVVDRRGERSNGEDLPEADRELARLREELARLEANLDVQRRADSTQPRVRRLDAVSARAAVDAAYLADWRRRVEAVGNQYYPEASLRYGIYGSLRMLVSVSSDGTLEGIRILESSGYAVLDEAAVRIVQTAAPFAPFPDELRATTDTLEILRTWQFEQNALSSQQQ